MRTPRTTSMASASLIIAFLGIILLHTSSNPTHAFSIGSSPRTITSRAQKTIRRHQRQSSLPSSPNDDGNEISEAFATPETIDPATKIEIRNIANHLADQTLESLLTQSEANAIIDELFFTKKSGQSPPIFNDKSYERYVKYWNKVVKRLREESDKTPADILGKELTNRILSSLSGEGDGNNSSSSNRNSKKGGSGKYDAQTVRAFLESDAVNSLFSKLLYDAIFEFTIKFDFIGNFISGLPLLGPVRNQVLRESKKQMDRTLGPLVQRFLSGYTRVAIRQAVDFVVSEENASAFGKANARLVGYLLEKRTISEWIPDDKTLDEWRGEVWSYLVGLEEGSEEGGGMVKEDQRKVVEQSIQWTYDLVGDKCVNDAGLDVNEILDSSPTLERKLGSFWQRCQDASKKSAE